MNMEGRVHKVDFIKFFNTISKHPFQKIKGDEMLWH